MCCVPPLTQRTPFTTMSDQVSVRPDIPPSAQLRNLAETAGDDAELAATIEAVAVDVADLEEAIKRFTTAARNTGIDRFEDVDEMCVWVETRLGLTS